MADEARSRLGRGLASLIGDVGGEAAKAERSRAHRRVPIEFLRANPHNPRKSFSNPELDELAQSIKEHGVIQPIVVRGIRGTVDSFEIIAGERRWRAAQRVGLHEVPIVTVEVSDTDALEIMIIENVQRADLNAIEEARGYQSLANEYRRSADDIAKVVGKSRSHVANMMRLTKLPDSVQELIANGDLSAGHARALINAKDAAELAERVIKDGLSVRQTEELARGEGGVTAKPQHKVRAGGAARPQKDPDTVALEKRVSDALGMAVSIDHRGEGGAVHVRYAALEQLDEIVRRLEGK